jgi:hypothetical protein
MFFQLQHIRREDLLGSTFSAIVITVIIVYSYSLAKLYRCNLVLPSAYLAVSFPGGLTRIGICDFLLSKKKIDVKII